MQKFIYTMMISMYLNNEEKMTLETSDRLTESFELIGVTRFKATP